MADDRGRQFDILDKALAARGYELLSRPSIFRQDYDAWVSDFNRLESYAVQNSDNSYVARQWSQEKPRYANAPSLLLAKVRTVNPTNYDTSISVSGQNSGCGCGSNIPQLPFVPTNITQGNFGNIPSRGSTNLFFGADGGGPSLGDNARQLFQGLPYFNTPGASGNKLVDKSQVTSGIIVALVVGVILWTIHYLTKGKVKLAA